MQKDSSMGEIPSNEEEAEYRVLLEICDQPYDTDYFLSAFPILILRKVQISLRSKIGLCLLMGLGVM